MRVLMFGWEFPPHISGGLGTACYGLTKGLSSFNDIHITFVVPKKHGDEDQRNIKLIGANEIDLKNFNIDQVKKLQSLKQKVKFSQLSAYITPDEFEKLYQHKREEKIFSSSTSSGGKLGFTGKYGSGLFEEIYRYGLVASEIARNEPHDIIHAHDWLTFYAGLEAKKTSGKPLVVHIHATEFDRCGENLNKQVYELEKYGMHQADRIITVSDYTRNMVIKKYNIKPEKVVTSHNGVEEINQYHETPFNFVKKFNEKVVTFLGRITYQKGPEYFIQAAYKVLQKTKNVRFVMAGSGNLINEMIKYVARLGISNKFHFTGFLGEKDVKRMYENSNLYVMPSVSEPFGISSLEAIQNNVPVIISKQSGVSEVLKYAIKIDFWDIDKMADAIYGVLNYSALRSFLTSNGKCEAAYLNWQNTAKKVRDIYFSLLYKMAG